MHRITDFRLSYAASLRLSLGITAAGIPIHSANADATWVGDLSADWEDAANWSSDPNDPSGVLTVNGGSPHAPVITADNPWAFSDLNVGFGTGQTGTLAHNAGVVSVGAGNWTFIGRDGGTGTYDLTGSGTLNAGAVNVGAWNGSGANGTLNINTSGGLTATGGANRPNGFGDASILVGEDGGTGRINLEAGVVSSSFGTVVGHFGGASGTIDMSGGTFDEAQFTTIGRAGGTGELNVSGGTYNNNAGNFFVGDDGTGEIAVSGSGVVNTNSWLILGANGGNGTLTVDGGQLNQGAGDAGSRLELTNPGSNGSAVVNLNGGTLLTNGLVKSGSGTATVNFDGGTLQARIDNPAFMQGLDATNVMAGGATLDTGGMNITIGQALLDGGGGGGLGKVGSGTLTLTGANTYTGPTNVNAGTLVIDGDNSGATGAVTVASGARLGGVGTVGGATTIASGGIHAPGNSPGVQTFADGITYSSDSIFEWELFSNTADFGKRGIAEDGYDAVDVTGDMTAGGVFRVLLGGTADFESSFWQSNPGSHTWVDVFDVSGTTSGAFSSFEVWDNGSMVSNFTDHGSFSFNSTTGDLTWSAVPEPSSALAGLLLGLGLLRRQRAVTAA